MTHLEEVLLKQLADAKDARDLAIRMGMQPPTPRMVLSRRAPLVLSTTPQRVAFTGGGSLDTNLFPFLNGTAGPRRVDWDPTAQVLRFADADQNYALQLDFTIAGGLRPADIFYRFIIPVPGAPLYFPNGDTIQRGHLTSLERSLASVPANITRKIYVGNEMQQYGLGLELISSTALVTHPTVSTVDLFLFA